MQAQKVTTVDNEEVDVVSSVGVHSYGGSVRWVRAGNILIALKLSPETGKIIQTMFTWNATEKMFTFVGLLDLVEDEGSIQADFIVENMEHVGEVSHRVRTSAERGTGWVPLNGKSIEFQMSFTLPKHG
ncbi:MAG TPA: hypothetical protein VJI96_04765 [Candidatus Andersenbacteria bacterium]|nr:hypothetical protein [Candidatus Andersenbacteria bacterium]